MQHNSRCYSAIAEMKANEPMNIDEPKFQAYDTDPSTPPDSILERARQAEIDPCIVAEEAMRGFVFGDLKPPAVASRSGLREAWYGAMETAFGPLLVAVTDVGVCAVSWLRHTDRHQTLREIEERGMLATESPDVVKPIIEQLTLYLDGVKKDFDVEIDLSGTSEFTHRSLDAIRSIPYGDVVTYGDVARSIQQPGAAQAVGNAMGRNPIPIIVPCHRVIRSDGSMGNYTGGADIKEHLLAIEGVEFGIHIGQTSLPFHLDF
jgi:methylated-DNA-[protein]-cysteine S-methyltransferase